MKKEPIPAEIVKLADERVEKDPRGAPITLPAPTCALDDAPINSELVVMVWPGYSPSPFLMTPKGPVDLSRDDYAWTLPLWAEIRRKGEHTFVAKQREAVDSRPDLICTTAVECIRQFKRHFHDARE